MKNRLLILLVTFSSIVFAQEKAVDILSVKAGLIGGWISYEKEISTNFTVSGDVGYEGGLFYNSLMSDDVHYIFTTTLNLTGRYYYNFERRIEKNKNTTNNAANFVAFQTKFTPNWGSSTSANNVRVLKTFTVFSKYGFKRNLSNRFNFEFAFGPGYQWAEKTDGGLTFGLDAHFGFNF